MQFRFTRQSIASSLAISLISTPLLAHASPDVSDNAKMENIVVTATRTATSLQHAPASVAIITSDDISAMSATNLNEIVAQAVGVESTKDGGRAGREFIKLRGMDAGFTLILLNGRRMTSSNAIVRGNDFDYSAIPPSSIERIEIIRGPMSSLYGSDALGGVINIITKQAANEWTGNLTTRLSSPENDGGERTQIGINTNGALIDDKLLLNLSINWQDRNAWKPFEDEGERARSTVTATEDRQNVSALANLAWLIDDNQTLNFDAGYSSDDREGVTETTRRLTPFDATVDRTQFSLTYNLNSAWGDSMLRYGYDSVDVEEGISDLAEINETNQIVEFSNTQSIGAHRLTYGGDARRTELDSERDLLETGESSVSQQALYAQDEWTLHTDWTVTLGGRMDFHEDFGSNFTPRAYVVHTLNDAWVIKGGYSEAFRAPSLLRLTPQYRLRSCRGSCFIIGNPGLSPETSKNYEISALYQDSGWTTELTFFHNDVENLIERDLTTVVGQQGERDVHTYQNTQKASIQGVEFANFMQVNDAVSLHVNYTYIDAKNDLTDETLLERPEHSVLMRTQWQVNDNLSAFFTYNFTGNQAIDGDLTLASYQTFDAGFSYDVNDEVSVRLGVNNLGDKAFAREATLRGYNQSPRTYWVNAAYQF